jgi:hypothetical protein
MGKLRFFLLIGQFELLAIIVVVYNKLYSIFILRLEVGLPVPVENKETARLKWLSLMKLSKN